MLTLRRSLLALALFAGLGMGPVVTAPAPALDQSVDGGAVLDGGLTASEPDDGAAEAFLPPSAVPSRLKAPPIERMTSLEAREDLLARAVPDGKGALHLPGPDGGTPLTIDVRLQQSLTGLLRDYQVPYGAVVVMEPSTGRVLAMAEHSEAAPGMRGLATRAVFPAASIFKIVTGSALLKAGVSAEQEACFHGGKRRLTEKLLLDSSRDGSCYSLATAMGKSANVIFAKLSIKHLTPELLRREAALFGFNRPIAFPVPTDVSLAAVPDDGFGFAATGAGFGDVFMSPLHGALLASVAANGGVWREPVLFAHAEAKASAEPVLTPALAASLADMLEATVTRGTARHLFRQRGFRVEDAVGKTGTLADRKPFRDYSWFVGYAPKDKPRVVVSAVVVNEPRWRIRATYVAREALRLGLQRVVPVKVEAPVLVSAPPP